MATTRERLVARLQKKDGHLGRNGTEIQNLAEASGLSVHTIQSFAVGRRNLSKGSDQALRDALAGRKTEAAEV